MRLMEEANSSGKGDRRLTHEMLTHASTFVKVYLVHYAGTLEAEKTVLLGALLLAYSIEYLALALLQVIHLGITSRTITEVP